MVMTPQPPGLHGWCFGGDRVDSLCQGWTELQEENDAETKLAGCGPIWRVAMDGFYYQISSCLRT